MSKELSNWEGASRGYYVTTKDHSRLYLIFNVPRWKDRHAGSIMFVSLCLFLEGMILYAHVLDKIVLTLTNLVVLLFAMLELH